jgi:iduronate 2-sulfatase
MNLSISSDWSSAYFRSVAWLLGFAVVVPALHAVNSPNILFIAADDLKPVLGCYGDSVIKTPNIDRLAARGTVFLQNYCQQAVCGPTRASLMTGKRPDHTKVWDLKTRMRDINPDIVTLPQYLAQRGYVTAGVGKIYDPRCIDNAKDQDKPSWSVPYLDIPDRFYFKHQPPALGYYQDPATRQRVLKLEAEARIKGLKQKEARDYVANGVKPSIENVDLPDNAYKDGAMADRAVEMMATLAKTKQQFFLAVGFARPHLPFVAPKKYWDLYRRDEIPLAKFQQHARTSPNLAYHNSGELLAYTDIPPLTRFTDVKTNGIGLPAEKQRELIHGYYAAVSYIDAQVGKLLDALEAQGLAQNTIVVLWGDHGWHLGDHDLWCKHTNFEQATRAPLLISAPGFASGKTASVSEFVDIFPTLCELSGVRTPAGLDGKSLVPLMRDPAASVGDFAVSQYPHEGKMGYSIRTRSHRLTWWMASGFRSDQPFSPAQVVARELYDYEKDPLETANVVDEKAYQGLAADLSEKMTTFFAGQRAAARPNL